MLSFDRAGSGEPLLLIHPLGGGRFVWDPVLPLLTPTRDVIAIDLPGFGASPRLPAIGDHSAAGLAREVAGLLDALGLDDAHLAGNSLGGWVALELERMGRARSVTAIAPAGLWPKPLGSRPGPDTRAIGSALRPLLSLLMRSRRVRRRILAGTVAHPDRVPVEHARRLVTSYLDAPGFDATNRAMRSNVFRLEPTATPVTFAWPEHDRLVSIPRGLPPFVRAVGLAGCGHVPMWDDPEQVAELLLAGSREPTAA